MRHKQKKRKLKSLKSAMEWNRQANRKLSQVNASAFVAKENKHVEMREDREKLRAGVKANKKKREKARLKRKKKREKK